MTTLSSTSHSFEVSSTAAQETLYTLTIRTLVYVPAENSQCWGVIVLQVTELQ